MFAYMTGKPVDRIPCLPLIGCHAARLTGCSVREYNLNAKLMADGQIAAYKLYNHDSLGIAPGLNIVAGAIGGRVHYPAENVPLMAENPLLVENRLSELCIPDATKDGDLPIYLEALRIIMEQVGKEVGVGLIIGGPISVASSIYGTERLLKSMVKRPEFTHRLLNLFINEGAQPVIVDPIASGSLISYNYAQTFAFPYTSRMIAELSSLCHGVVLHICGDSSKILRLMADAGPSCLSIDNIVDLEYVKNEVGSRVAISGNVTPGDTMLRGTPQKVISEARKCLRKAYGSPRGYILSTGCDLPIETPQENILALMQAARTYGKWPINPELLYD
jgi:uroporphyrinogen decarboxylase